MNTDFQYDVFLSHSATIWQTLRVAGGGGADGGLGRRRWERMV
jgi:hypothetical protein